MESVLQVHFNRIQSNTAVRPPRAIEGSHKQNYAAVRRFCNYEMLLKGTQAQVSAIILVHGLDPWDFLN